MVRSRAAGAAVAAIALVALSCVLPADGLHFLVKEGAIRCFIEEVPAETVVVAEYKNPDLAAARDGQSIKITVKNPANDVISTQIAQESGRIVFTSHLGGEHLVCLTTTGNWGSREFRFELNFLENEKATDYEELAKMEHLSAIEVEVRKLADKVGSLRAEQDYQRQREVQFRDTAESTNSRVLWWSLVQTTVLVVVGVWQVLQLKTFFKTKKLA